MPKKRFTDVQGVFAVRQVESGKICRKIGVA